VTFDDETAQKKAVEEMNGREVESRAISVKVAIDKPREEKENGDHPPVAANGSSS
jgi:RNA recognition motif-containing protein